MPRKVEYRGGCASTNALAPNLAITDEDVELRGPVPDVGQVDVPDIGSLDYDRATVAGRVGSYALDPCPLGLHGNGLAVHGGSVGPYKGIIPPMHGPVGVACDKRTEFDFHVTIATTRRMLSRS